MKRFILISLLSSTLFASEKLIIIFTHMNNCSWCEKMKKETIENIDALKEIKKHFLLSKIKRESGNMPSFLKPELFPTTYILSSNGMKVLDMIDGYMKRDEFLYHINTIYEIEQESKKLSKQN